MLMSYMVGIEFIATILTIWGVVVISVPKRYGLWILVYAQILWCIFAYAKNTPFFLFSSVFLLVFILLDCINGKRKE